MLNKYSAQILSGENIEKTPLFDFHKLHLKNIAKFCLHNLRDNLTKNILKTNFYLWLNFNQ